VADQRHRTVIEIGVDDREIRGLERAVRRTFDDRVLLEFEKGIERSARAMENLARQTERYEKIVERLRRAGVPVGGGGGGGGGGVGAPPLGGGGGGGGAAQAAAINNLTRAIEGLRRTTEQQGRRQMGRTAAGTMLGQLGAGAARGTFTQALVTAVPFIGPIFGAGLGAMQQFYSEFTGAEEARARTVGQRGRTGRTAAAQMAQYGYDRGQAYGQLAALGQVSGRRGAALGRISPQLMAAQEDLGLRQLGGIIGAAEVAGGQVRQQDESMLLNQALASGVAAGIRITRLDQYFAQTAATISDLRARGFDVTPDTILQLTGGFGEMGFRGASAARMATQMTRGMVTGGLGTQPGIASLLALEAAGYGQEGISFHDAMRRIESGDPATISRMVDIVNRSAGPSEEARAEYHRLISPQAYGGQISYEDAYRLARGDTSALLLGGAPLAEAPSGQALSARAQQQAQAARATSAGEAAYRNQRIGVGAEMGEGVRAMRRLDMRIINTVLPRLADGVEAIVQWIEGGLAAFEEGGVGGMISRMLGEVFSGFMSHIATAINEAFTDIAVTIAEAINNTFGTNIDIDRIRRRGQEQVQAARDAGADPGGELSRMFDYWSGRDNTEARRRAAAGAPGRIATEAEANAAFQPGSPITARAGRSPDDILRAINNARRQQNLRQYTRGDFPGTQWTDQHTVQPLGPDAPGAADDAAAHMDDVSRSAAAAAEALRQAQTAPEGSVRTGGN
jgi:hypothetical protein